MRSQDWNNWWWNHSWKYLSLIGYERIINLESTKVYVFSDSVLCLGKIQQSPESNEAWEQRFGWIKSSQNYWYFDRIDGEPTEFEWNIFPRFNTLQLSEKVKSLLSRLGETPETFKGRILFMSMFNDISCDKKDNEEECVANAQVVSILARKFGIGQRSFIGPGSERKWFSSENSPQGAWDHIADEMLLEFAESGHPTFRATTQLSRGQLKSKRRGRLSIHSVAVQEMIETIFRIIVSANQLSRRDVWRIRILSRKNGATCCDGAINCAQCDQDRSSFGEWWSSISEFSITTIWRTKLRSYHNRKIEKNSVWMQDFWVLCRLDSISWRKTLEIWHNSMEWLVVNTLFQEKNQHHNQKDGSKETPKLDPCWKLQPVTCTVNMELRSELCLWAETILTLGSEFLMDQMSLW